MTEVLLKRSPDLDFLYYSNDMIGAGGLLYCLDQGIDVPGQIGMAGFNGLELIQGLPLSLATMDACRREIGEEAAGIIAARMNETTRVTGAQIVLTPKLSLGQTLLRKGAAIASGVVPV
jgi:LacI family gluconate utilization system Gnt-I transcriptional repressor